jgi:hypothetical protein
MTQRIEAPKDENILHPKKEAIHPTMIIIFTSLLVLASIYLFTVESTSEQVSTMLDQQNAAALKLWPNLIYFDHHHKAEEDQSLPPGLRDDLVEFSRTTARIYKVVHRLGLVNIFADENWSDILKTLNKGSIDLDGQNGQKTSSSLDGKAPAFNHVVVPTNIDSKEICRRGILSDQIVPGDQRHCAEPLNPRQVDRHCCLHLYSTLRLRPARRVSVHVPIPQGAQ